MCPNQARDCSKIEVGCQGTSTPFDGLYLLSTDIESNVRKKMNAADRKEFDIIHNKIDNIKADIEKMNQDINNAHQKTDEVAKKN